MTSIQFDATPTGYSGNYIIYVDTIRPNRGEYGYDATAEVQVTDGMQTKTAKLIQYAQPALKAEEAQLINIPQAGSTLHFVLLSHYPVRFENVPDYVTIKDGDTIIQPDTKYTPRAADVIKQNGDGTTIEMIFAPNNTGQDRITQDSFRMNHYSGSTPTNLMVYINTTQLGEMREPVYVNPTALHFPQTGGTVVFHVSAAETTSWTITGKPTWLTLSATGGTGNMDITATTTANNSNANRSISMRVNTSNDWISLGANQEGRSELRLTATTSGNIKWCTTDAGWVCSIQYSKNNGAWRDIRPTVSGTSISVSAGDQVRFRGAHTAYGNSRGMFCHFDGTAKFNISGYLYSLLSYTGYSRAYYMKDYLFGSDNFRGLFYNTNAVDASGLIMQENNMTPRCYKEMFRECYSLTAAPALPAMDLAEGCYANMFQECTALNTAPVLPAAYMAPECYSEMFTDCEELNYVKCLAITLGQGSTYNWLAGVEQQGQFWMERDADFWFAGDSGIPQGWEWKYEGIDEP